MSRNSAHFRVPSLFDKRGTTEVKSIVANIGGVNSVKVNSSVNRITVDYDTSSTTCEQIKNAMDKKGYNAEIISNHDHGFY